MGGTATGFADFFPILFKTNLIGDVTDSMKFLSVPFGAITSLAPTIDSGFILTGSSYNFWNQTSDIGFISKLDANLQVEWEFTFEDSLDKQGASNPTISRWQLCACRK